jgi:hypothetical protein
MFHKSGQSNAETYMDQDVHAAQDAAMLNMAIQNSVDKVHLAIVDDCKSSGMLMATQMALLPVQHSCQYVHQQSIHVSRQQIICVLMHQAS